MPSPKWGANAGKALSLLHGIGLGAVLLVSVLLRVLFPYADPPAHLSGSGGLFFDEGALVHNARNTVLFGQWRLDEFNSYYYSPLLHFVQVLVFHLLGVGFLQERLIPIVLGSASVFLIYRFASEAWSREAGLYSALFLGTSFYAVMYSRLGLLETPYTFLMVLTAFLWNRGRNKHWMYSVAAGVSGACVYVSKSLALYFVAAFTAVLIVDVLMARGADRRRAVQGMAAVFLGMAVVMGLWYLLFFSPNREDILRIGEAWKRVSMPRSAAQLFNNLHDNPFFSYFLRSPVALATGFAGAGAVVAATLARWRRFDAAEWLVVLWLAAGVLGLGVLSYRPDRYYVPLIPAVALMAGRALATRAADPEGSAARSWAFLAWIIGWLWAAVAIRYMVLVPVVVGWRIGSLGPRWIQWALAAVLAAGLVFILINLSRRPKMEWTRIWRPAAVGILLVASVLIDGRQYAVWAKGRQYTMVQTSRELAGVVGEGTVAGLAAPALCLENRAKTLYAWEPWFNFDDPFGRYPISHMVLAVYNGEVSWYWQKFPTWMEKAHLIRVLRLWQSDFYMFSMNPDDKGIFNKLRKDRGGVLDAAIVQGEFPSEMKAGSSAEAWIRVRNTGREEWSTSGGIFLGAATDSNPLGPRRIPLPDGSVVRSGDTRSIRITYTAPNRPGYYATEWRLVKEGVAWFGDSRAVGVKVVP
jgi:4-amino-4-deoxy-L-arabinose transferase-like glycosyltransferase